MKSRAHSEHWKQNPAGGPSVSLKIQNVGRNGDSRDCTEIGL